MPNQEKIELEKNRIDQTKELVVDECCVYEVLVEVFEGCHDGRLVQRWIQKPGKTSEDGWESCLASHGRGWAENLGVDYSQEVLGEGKHFGRGENAVETSRKPNRLEREHLDRCYWVYKCSGWTELRRCLGD